MNLFTQRVINKAQELRPWVRKVGPNRYRVTPRTSDHGKYELTTISEGENVIVTNCVEIRTGEQCKGFEFDAQCYHSARLLLHLIPKLIACKHIHQMLDERMPHVQMEAAVLFAIDRNGGMILPQKSA